MTIQEVLDKRQIAPSEWCREQYGKAIEAGRLEDADNYRQMFELWYNRGM